MQTFVKRILSSDMQRPSSDQLWQMPEEAALPMPPEFLREELDEEHEASYFAESDKILSFAFKSIVSPEYIVSLNGDFGKIWARIGEKIY